MNVYIKKIQELEDAEHPNNIPVKNERTITDIHPDYFKEPTIGESFSLNGLNRWFITSTVTQILCSNTFKTLNSVYEWKILKS